MKVWSVLFLVAVLGLELVPTNSQQVDCQTDPLQCGRNSQCVDSVCQCDDGCSSDDGTNCLHDFCNVEGCFQCLDEKRCSRCRDIVIEGSGVCTSTCPYQESLQFHGDFVGRVCTYPSQTESLPTAYTAIIAVICAGIVLAIVIGLACFIHQRRTQGNFDFLYGKPDRHKEAMPAGDSVTNEKYRRDPGTESTTASELPVKVNSQKTNPVHGNKGEFLRQVSELKPHAETFLKMLNDVRRRYRALKHGNPRAVTYKAVIRDLSRVLFILNKKETALKMPPDGNELMKWAARSLKNYENCQSVIKTETENKEEKTGIKMVATDTPESVWIESKDETSSLYKDVGSVESKLI